MPSMQFTSFLSAEAAFQLRFGLGVEEISCGVEAGQILC